MFSKFPHQNLGNFSTISNNKSLVDGSGSGCIRVSKNAFDTLPFGSGGNSVIDSKSMIDISNIISSSSINNNNSSSSSNIYGNSDTNNNNTNTTTTTNTSVMKYSELAAHNLPEPSLFNKMSGESRIKLLQKLPGGVKNKYEYFCWSQKINQLYNERPSPSLTSSTATVATATILD